MWRGVEYGPVHAISACTGRVRRQFEICGYGRQYSKSGCAPLCRRSRHLQELIGKERRARLLKTGADAVQSFSISVTSFLGHRCLVTSVGRPGSTARSRPILSSDRPLRHENLGPLALSCGLNGCHKGCLRMEKDCTGPPRSSSHSKIVPEDNLRVGPEQVAPTNDSANGLRSLMSCVSLHEYLGRWYVV